MAKRRDWFDEGSVSRQDSTERTGLLRAIAEAPKPAPEDPLTRLWQGAGQAEETTAGAVEALRQRKRQAAGAPFKRHRRWRG